MWTDRLREEPRFRDAVTELLPYALGVARRGGPRRALVERCPGGTEAEPVERGTHVDEWGALWDEMTMVRRSVPGAAW